MDSAAAFKAAIKEIVAAYKRDDAEEYALLCKAVEMHRKALKDPEFGKSEGDMRALTETSDTLENMLIKGLSVEALKWYKEKEGSHWFAKNYKEFSLTRRI